MEQNIILLDLFSGTGGFTKGLSDAGFAIHKHYFSEKDPHAIANYRYNFPHAEYLGTVEHVLNAALDRTYPLVITFGSPCQDFSVAGKRAGLDGGRSSLISYALDLIARLRPHLYIWENVKGTFSSNSGQDFWAIVQAFAHIGGYVNEWQLVNTSWLLPQNRERIYLAGHLAGRSAPGIFPFTEDDRLSDKAKQSGQPLSQAQHSTSIRPGNGSKADNTFIQTDTHMVFVGGLSEPFQGKGNTLRDFRQQHRVFDAKKSQNATTVVATGHSKYLITDIEDEPYRIFLDVERLYEVQSPPKILSLGHGYVDQAESEIRPSIRSSSFEHNNFVLVEPSHKHGEQRIYEDIAPCIQTRYGTGGDNVPYVVESQNSMIQAISTVDRAHKQQNGKRIKDEGEAMFTITGSDTHGVVMNQDYPNIKHQNTSNIRRLTEIECERLQGFPDDWTKWGIYDRKVWTNKKLGTFEIVQGIKQIPKTQRYKLCGNAVTAKMVQKIGERVRLESL